MYERKIGLIKIKKLFGFSSNYSIDFTLQGWFNSKKFSRSSKTTKTLRSLKHLRCISIYLQGEEGERPPRD